MGFFRTWAALIASVLVAAVGVGLFFAVPLIGIFLTIGGLALAGWRGWEMWRERPDPYDLKRLWDAPLPDKESEPDDDLLDGEELAYCHRCGHAVDRSYARCPECGTLL